MAIAIDKMDGRGHFNTTRGERLPKKTEVLAAKDYLKDGALHL